MEPFFEAASLYQLELHCILAMVDHLLLPGPIHPDHNQQVPVMNGMKSRRSGEQCNDEGFISGKT